MKKVSSWLHNTYAVPQHTICRPLGNDLVEDMVYIKKFYPPGQEYTVDVMPVSIPAHLPYIQCWVAGIPYSGKPGYSWPAPDDLLLKTYSYIRQCSFIQAFMCQLNQTPAGVVEICLGRRDELKLFYDVLPGDYTIRLIVAPDKKNVPGIWNYMLQTFLEYCVSWQEVKRVIIEKNDMSGYTEQILTAAGFCFLQQAVQPGKVSNLYYFSFHDHQ